MTDFLRYVPGIVGFLAPFVAAASGLLPADRIRAKWTLVVVGLLLGGLSFGSNAYFESRQSAARQAQQEQLGLFIEEGDKLLEYIYSSPQPFEPKPYLDWTTKIEAYLRDELGQTYVRRFRSQAVITSGVPVGIQFDRMGYYDSVRMRNAQLQIFISERRAQ